MKKINKDYFHYDSILMRLGLRETLIIIAKGRYLNELEAGKITVRNKHEEKIKEEHDALQFRFLTRIRYLDEFGKI